MTSTEDDQLSLPPRPSSTSSTSRPSSMASVASSDGKGHQDPSHHPPPRPYPSKRLSVGAANKVISPSLLSPGLASSLSGAGLLHLHPPPPFPSGSGSGARSRSSSVSDASSPPSSRPSSTCMPPPAFFPSSSSSASLHALGSALDASSAAASAQAYAQARHANPRSSLASFRQASLPSMLPSALAAGKRMSMMSVASFESLPEERADQTTAAVTTTETVEEGGARAVHPPHHPQASRRRPLSLQRLPALSTGAAAATPSSTASSPASFSRPCSPPPIASPDFTASHQDVFAAPRPVSSATPFPPARTTKPRSRAGTGSRDPMAAEARRREREREKARLALDPEERRRWEKRLEKRRRIALELLETERQYVGSLNLIHDAYLSPLLAALPTSTSIAPPFPSSAPSPSLLPSPYLFGGDVASASSSSLVSKEKEGGEKEKDKENTTSASFHHLSSAHHNLLQQRPPPAAPPMDRKAIADIFSNFVDIYNLNSELLARLDERLGDDLDKEEWERERGIQMEVRGERGMGMEVEVEVEMEKGREDGTPTVGGREPASARSLRPLSAPPSAPSSAPSPPPGTPRWDPHTSLLGDILLPLSPFLKMYSLFVKNFSSALSRVETERKLNEPFERWLAATEKALRDEAVRALAAGGGGGGGGGGNRVASHRKLGLLGFQAHLLTVVQRIPRYRLLVGDLLQCTDEDHPDYANLSKAYKIIDQVAYFIDDNVRQHEMILSMLTLQRSLVNLTEPLVVPGRKLVKRGSLQKACRKDVQPREFVLFSDSLLYATVMQSGLGVSVGTVAGGLDAAAQAALQALGMAGVATGAAGQPAPGARQHALAVTVAVNRTPASSAASVSVSVSASASAPCSPNKHGSRRDSAPAAPFPAREVEAGADDKETEPAGENPNARAFSGPLLAAIASSSPPSASVSASAQPDGSDAASASENDDDRRANAPASFRPPSTSRNAARAASHIPPELVPGQQLHFRRKFMLEDCTFVGVGDTDKTRFCFEIRTPGKSFAVYANSQAEKEEWMTALRETKAEHMSARRTLKTEDMSIEGRRVHRRSLQRTQPSRSPPRSASANAARRLALGASGVAGPGPGPGRVRRSSGNEADGEESTSHDKREANLAPSSGASSVVGLSTGGSSSSSSSRPPSSSSVSTSTTPGVQSASSTSGFPFVPLFNGVGAGVAAATASSSSSTPPTVPSTPSSKDQLAPPPKDTTQGLRVLEDYMAPVWVPDSKADRCRCCNEVFGIWRRKHHCRLCGQVVCWACSSRNFLIPSEDGAEDRPARACDPCYDAVFPSESPVVSPQTQRRSSENVADFSPLRLGVTRRPATTASSPSSMQRLSSASSAPSSPKTPPLGEEQTLTMAGSHDAEDDPGHRRISDDLGARTEDDDAQATIKKRHSSSSHILRPPLPDHPRPPLSKRFHQLPPSAFSADTFSLYGTGTERGLAASPRDLLLFAPSNHGVTTATSGAGTFRLAAPRVTTPEKEKPALFGPDGYFPSSGAATGTGLSKSASGATGPGGLPPGGSGGAMLRPRRKPMSAAARLSNVYGGPPPATRR